MDVEYDPDKSVRNHAKHGIDFIAAQALWDDIDRIEIPALTANEARWLVIGRIDGAAYSAVITYREDRIRIISVRRARKEEEATYEG